jgi:hypothetical protein
MALPPLPKKPGLSPGLPTATSGALPPLPRAAGAKVATPAPAGKKFGGQKSGRESVPKQVLGHVGGFFPGLVRLAGGLGNELLSNIRPSVGTPGGAPAQQAPLAEAVQKGSLEPIRARMPIAYELGSSPVRTVRTLNPQDLLVDIPTGNWSKTALGKRVQKEGVIGTGLATAADLSLLAGGAGLVGKGLGLGGLARAARLEELASASSRAAGLGKVADAAKLEEAASAAAAAGKVEKAGDLARAADQAREASRLRQTTGAAGRARQVGEKAVEVAEDVKTFGAHVAASPAKPYVWAGKGIAAGARKAGVAERLAPVIESARERLDFSDKYHREVVAPKQEALYRTLKQGGLEDVARNLSHEEQVAWSLVKSKEGLDPAVARLVDAAPDKAEALTSLFPRGDVTPEAYDLARRWEAGTLPEEQARRLDDARTRLDAMLGEHEVRYVAGEGERDVLSPEALEARRQRAAGQPAEMDVATVRERLQAPVQRRLEAIEAESEALRTRNLEQRPAAPLTAAGERQVARDQGRTAVFRSIERQARKRTKGVATAERQTARAEEAAGARAERLQGEANRRLVRQDERRLATLQERRDVATTKLEELARKAEDDVRAAPPQDRPALLVNQRAASLARDLARAHPDQAAVFHGLADEMAKTTRELRAKGLAPEFIFGGKEAAKPGPVTSTGGPALRGRKALGGRARTEGVLQRTVAGQVERYADQVQRGLVNNFAGSVQDRFGSTAGKTLRDAGHSADELRAMTPAQMHSALEEAGYRAWEPAGSGRAAHPETVSVNSAVVPKALFDRFEGYMGKNEHGLRFKALKVYDEGTKTWKHTVLALSPRWHVGNVMGNTVLASLGAGLSPLEIVRYLPQARRLVKSGEAPIEITSRGFYAADLSAELRPARTPLGKAIGKSYSLNEYVDNVGRTMVYLAKKGKGVSGEAAIKLALRAAGDFSRMTPFERNVARRVIPFYAWQKHITKLAFRLPLENPARVAWTLHLADVADRLNPDPGADNIFNAGSVGVPFGFSPLGIKKGDRLSLKGFDPIGSSFFVDPSLRSAGYSLNPVLKAGVVATTGMSPNRGFQPISTPEAGFGEGAQGGFGVRHPVRMAQYLAENFPQLKQAQDVVAGEAPIRHETGQPRKSRGGPIKSTGRWRLEQLARLAGVPFPEPEQKPTKPKR